MTWDYESPFGMILAPDPATGEMKELHISGDGRFIELVTAYWPKDDLRAWWEGREWEGFTWDLTAKVEAAIGWMHETPGGGALAFVGWVAKDGVFHVVPVAGKVIVHETPSGLFYPPGTYGPWPVEIGRKYVERQG